MKKEDRYLQEARYKKFLNENWDDSKAKIINRFMDYATDYLSIDRPKIKLINQEVAKISKVENQPAPKKITAPELPGQKPEVDTSIMSQSNAAPTFTTKNVSGPSRTKNVQIIDANGKVVATVRGNQSNIKRLVRAKLKALGAEV